MHYLRDFDPFEAGYGQWTLHVRASRAWRWGAANGPGPACVTIAPLVGSISGRVWTGPADAAVPMEAVWVLVGDREARLPADLDPAGTAVASVTVRPGREATAGPRRGGTEPGRSSDFRPGSTRSRSTARPRQGIVFKSLQGTDAGQPIRNTP